MITLYNVPVSSYGAKVRIILQHKGLDWTEAAPPDGYGSAAYKRIVPAGTVPAIIHGGLTLADSEAIAEYLDESFPTPPMMPADVTARARARELSRFHDTRLEPVLRSFFGQVAPSGRDATFIAETGALLQARLDQLATIAAPAPLMTGSSLPSRIVVSSPASASSTSCGSFSISRLFCRTRSQPMHPRWRPRGR